MANVIIDRKGDKLPSSSSFHSNIILVVDDEPVITETLVLVLNHSNQKLFAFGFDNVADAITMVRGVQPDLVLLDVMMPGADGLSHALEMDDKCGCKVLLMSGQMTTADVVDEYLKTGREPFEIIAKPTHPTELINKIQEMLRRQPSMDLKNPLSFHVQ